MIPKLVYFCHWFSEYIPRQNHPYLKARSIKKFQRYYQIQLFINLHIQDAKQDYSAECLLQNHEILVFVSILWFASLGAFKTTFNKKYSKYTVNEMRNEMCEDICSYAFDDIWERWLSSWLKNQYILILCLFNINYNDKREYSSMCQNTHLFHEDACASYAYFFCTVLTY